MEQHFNGKTVLVTGAGWGIGAATALLYAASGAKVIVSDTSRKGGKDTLARIKDQKGNAIYIQADVSSQTGCEELIKTTIQAYGSIDIACNNSAVFCETPRRADGNMESFDHQKALNLSSLNNCMQYEIEAMQKRRGGVIINTLSIVGAIGTAPSIKYIETKYGTVTLPHNIREESPAIHIHTIAPSFIATALLKERLHKKMDGKINLSPMGMHGTIQEVAGLILWLSSDESYRMSTAFKNTN
jgi:NAD(P)-dependent dehydrogenase (short-subunit alcohol dehydrogenase family)